MAGVSRFFTPDIVAELCSRLSEGETLSQICRDEHMPSKSTVLDWVNDDKEGFADQYARARDRQLEHWADELLSISDDGRNDWMVRNGGDVAVNSEHIQRSKLRSDNRKWLLSKLKPGKYGDRVEHVGAGGKDLIPEGTSDTARITAAFLAALKTQEP
jgi:hypothetical protein